MKKKVLASILFFTLIILLVNNSFAALKTTATFTANSNKVEKGKEVTCTFAINVTEGDVYGIEGYLKYDKDFFSSITVNSSYNINSGNGFDQNSGLIGIEGTNKIPSGTLFTANLKVNEQTTKTSGIIEFSGVEVFDNTGSTEGVCSLSISPIEITLKASEEKQEEKEEKIIKNIADDSNKSTKAIPKAGINVIVFVAIVIVLATAIIAFIKYKNIAK